MAEEQQVTGMTAAQYRQYMGAKGRSLPNKYGAKKTGGYDSRKEARYALKYRTMEKRGEISDLKEQVRFELLPSQLRADGKKELPVHYTADFTFRDGDGNLVVVDVKGYRTRDYVMRRKLMLYLHGITVVEPGGADKLLKKRKAGRR